MELKVNEKRTWISSKTVLEVKAVYLTQAIVEQSGEVIPYSVKTILEHSEPYQEPKPVRKLEAWEIKDDGYIAGDIRFTFEGSPSSKFNSSRPSIYRKLSDEELKELIKGGYW